MAKRLRFDIYEAVILHDAYMRYEKGLLTRQQAVKDVSRILRARAKSSGVLIDESFRNETGISFQLGVMQHAATGGKKGIAQRSRLFDSVVLMYAADRQKYYETLKTALGNNAAGQNKKNSTPTAKLRISESGDPFLDYLSDNNIKYIDKRIKGGCLWIIGGKQLKLVVDEAKKQDIKFHYSENGGRVTGRKSAWWTLQKTDKFVRPDQPRSAGVESSDSEAHRASRRKKATETRSAGRAGVSPRNITVEPNSAAGFKQWMMGSGLAESSSRSYASAINNAEQFAKARGYDECCFYGNADIKKIRILIDTLFGDKDFIEQNEEQHYRFSAAFKRYTSYIESGTSGIDEDGLPVESRENPVSNEIQRRIVEVVAEGFPNGIRPNSVIDKKKTGRLYQERYGVEAPEDDVIEKILSNRGVSWNGKIYLIDDEAKRQIRDCVERALSTGNRIIYFGELYEAYASFYASKMIYSSDALRRVMEDVGVRLLFYKNFCTVGRGVTVEDELCRAFDGDVRLTVEELKHRLPYIPLEKITPSLSCSDKFVRVRAGEYAIVAKIDIDPDDKIDAVRLIGSEIASNGFASLGNVDLTRTLGNNPTLTEVAIRDAFFIQVLSEKYSKKGQIVTSKGAAVSANDIMRQQCRMLEEATLDDLDEVEKSITGQAKNAILPIAFETMVRVDREEFVNDDRVKFDVDAVDDALAFFVGNRTCPIKAITSFNSFPYVGQPWTLYLIESYVARFSKAYRIMGGPARTDNVGAIYPCELEYADYGDLIAHVLADSSIDLQGDGATEYLIRVGYVLRKTTFVRTAIERARMLREIRG